MTKNSETGGDRHTPKQNAFSVPVRIYYEDTDAGGVVYHANYLGFMERCRTEWFRAVTGQDQAALARDLNLAFAVRAVELEYLRPAHLDDLLTVSLEVESMGRSKVVFRQHVRRDSVEGSEELVTGKVQVVCVSLNPMKSAPIPDFLREKLEALL